MKRESADLLFDLGIVDAGLACIVLVAGVEVYPLSEKLDGIVGVVDVELAYAPPW